MYNAHNGDIEKIIINSIGDSDISPHEIVEYISGNYVVETSCIEKYADLLAEFVSS